MSYKMFLDDVRDAPDNSWIVCRSSQEALDYIAANGPPNFFSLDHDLGGDDTTMVFLKRWVQEIWDGVTPPPDYIIHSANPIGAQNIDSYLKTWKKILK